MKDNTDNILDDEISISTSPSIEKLSQSKKPLSKSINFSIDCYKRSASYLSSRRLFGKKLNNYTKKLILILPIITLILIIYQLSNGFLPNETNQFIYYKSPSTFNLNPLRRKQVPRKKDLLKVDITKLVNGRDLSRSPITEKMLNQDYITNILTGFVSNLQLDSHKRQNLAANHDKHNHKQHNNTSSSDLFPKEASNNIVDVKGLEKQGRKSYDSLVTCEDLSYNATIEHSLTTNILSDDLMSIRRGLLKDGDWLIKELKDDRDKDKTEEEIVDMQWFRFGGSSVWLESEQCYLVFTRIVYSRVNRKNHPHLSLIRGQAYDKDWNEVIGKKIPYLDITFPKNMEKEMENLNIELNIEDCTKYSGNSLEFENCNVQQAKTKLRNEKKKEHVISKYYVTYPTVFDFPFQANGDFKGPEDPRVIIRKTETTEEPVILFNMHDGVEDKRRMFSYMPHRKIDPLVKFKIFGRGMRNSEKNWTPFFHPSDQAQSGLSRGSIHFIYTFSPLDIIKCSLNDGNCEIVFDQETLEISDSNTFGGMRGGTQFIPLPQQMPGINNKNIWVGFPKLHIKNCGCGETFYRPMLDVLVESNGIYHQELVVPAIDFDIDVLSWDMKSTECQETNILSPNSISHWNIIHQDPETKSFDDYMTLTVSESDILTKVITLKGVLNYILGIYRVKNMKDDFLPDRESDDIIGRTLSCLIAGAKQHCAIYGEMHKVFKPDKKKGKKGDSNKKTQLGSMLPGPLIIN
ncbi:similar to Naumovozyma dairenensis NDAI_0G00360 hypothetical protein [Maudiozyma saulgeensis]|uniref:Uncharacterized protein n=1 Tax=Maudiozyma saulgeensis TaxID=1789683 RepID=A0A1X7R6Y9_9SACH|nr:similar to Naumovozyma dairenensis NDAI_0G00360 hypothetical protein [Kazachstania saulgeensis]